MRTEQEMYDIILGFAKKNEDVRAVVLNGSRGNPNVKKDKYQDYDIIYVIRELEKYKADYSWLEVFGNRLIMQVPQTMRYPSDKGHFNWQMLFFDGNRIDLTLVPMDKLELVEKNSFTKVLLDKDGIITPFSPIKNKDYKIKMPDELFYYSCCNEFFWCMQNVAKGIARDEVPYAVHMYYNVVFEELHNMITWYIGVKNGFDVSVGKMGRHFKKYLPPNLYEKYLQGCPSGNDANLWLGVFAACDLFCVLAKEVGKYFGYSYNQKDDDGMRNYLYMVKDDVFP